MGVYRIIRKESEGEIVLYSFGWKAVQLYKNQISLNKFIVTYVSFHYKTFIYHLCIKFC